MDSALLERLCDKPILAERQPKAKVLPDLLNHGNVAKIVLSTIAQATKINESPCIAIFGPWGSGKTGILNLIHKELDEKTYIWHYTDAWHNQRDDLAMLEILRELFEKAGPDFKSAFLRLIWVFSGHAASSLFGAFFPDVLKPGGLETAIQAAFPKGFPPSREQLIRHEFSGVVQRLTEHGKKRLVIAIDNLDRCRPESALRILETLFLITSVRDCAFIVAADQQVLVSFLNREYQGTEFSGTKYLETVFPHYFRVPDPWVAWEHDDAKGVGDESSSAA